MIISKLQVMQSAAGYYIGHAYLEDDMVTSEKDGEEFVGIPYSRESEYYFPTAKSASDTLKRWEDELNG